MSDIEVLQKYEYNKRLALFELDVIKKEKEKGCKTMDIPDAVAPELREEVYSLYKTDKIEEALK